MYQVRKKVFGVAALALLSSFATKGLAAGPTEAEKRAACTGDAMRFCSSMIGNMDQVEGCLRAHRARLGPSCKALFDKYDVK
jgi:hypothetical protein